MLGWESPHGDMFRRLLVDQQNTLLLFFIFLSKTNCMYCILYFTFNYFFYLKAHRDITPYLISLCGEGYRLDHQPIVILQNKNSEGFSLHGGPLSGMYL